MLFSANWPFWTTNCTKFKNNHLFVNVRFRLNWCFVIYVGFHWSFFVFFLFSMFSNYKTDDKFWWLSLLFGFWFSFCLILKFITYTGIDKPVLTKFLPISYAFLAQKLVWGFKFSIFWSLLLSKLSNYLN